MRDRIGVKRLRAELKTFLDAGATVSIGSMFTCRAILVPIPPHNRWDAKEFNAAMQLAKKRFHNQWMAELHD